MKYCIMTKEKAIEEINQSPGKNVLVAIVELGDEDNSTMFSPRVKTECEEIICDAKTITSIDDDFIKRIDCFSEKQNDLENIKCEGFQKIILIP